MNSISKTDAKLQLLTEMTEGAYEAFLYDCDGTLADNVPAHKAAFVKAAAQYGIDLDDSIVDELAGWPTVLVATEISKRYKVDFDIQEFSKLKTKVFFEDFIEETKPIAFVVDHLKNHLGKVKVGVVSGGSRGTVSKTLSVLGIFDHLDVMVCAGETPKGKPFPDPFLLAAEKLGVAPEKCVVFEDAEAGVIGAQAAGMKAIRVDKL